MINEFSARVKSSNNNARVAFITLLALCGATVVAYSAIPLYKGLVGLVAIAFLTAAILIYTRYMAPTYYYDVTHDYEGTPIFVVRQVVGRRETTLSRITLSDIIAIDVEDAAARRAHKTEYGYRKYVYTPTLSPEKTCRITVRNRYESAEIVIESGDDFANLLRSYVNEAKASRLNFDDE